MKYVVAVMVLVAAFIVGRCSVVRESDPLPGLPVAFVQATQPIAVTVDVNLATENVASTSDGIYELEGSAVYRFTNLTEEVVSIAFPPTRTFAITSRYLGRSPLPCPSPLASNEIVEIPPQSSITRSGEWSTTITGDVDEFLQSGAREAYTFSSPNSEPSFSGTLIAFQAFTGVKPKSHFHTTVGHLELVSPPKSP